MALIARGQGHRPVSALEAGLIAASLCEFVFLGAALCTVFSPELVPWLVPCLGVLLACASASAIVVFLLLFLFSFVFFHSTPQFKPNRHLLKPIIQKAAYTA